jgi:cephalosporin hydroxylase
MQLRRSCFAWSSVSCTHALQEPNDAELILAAGVCPIESRLVFVVARRALHSLAEEPREFLGKAARYPGLYLAALSARRSLPREAACARTGRDAVEFAMSYRWGGVPIEPIQNRREIERLLDILERQRPRTVLEIGAFNGGTLFLWSRVALPDATIISIDLGGSVFGGRSPLGLVCRGFARERQRIELLFRADSHDPATFTSVERILGGDALDFLFIDGDHTYDGVKADFQMYSGLVGAGGLIAIHDIVTEAGPQEKIDVPRFWSDLKQRWETEELVAGDEPRLGIGLVRPRSPGPEGPFREPDG